MLDTLYIEEIEQADALLKPERVAVLRQLAEPSTCTQVGQVLEKSPQAVYYHVKRLQSAGLAELVSEHRVRGITEGVYQAVARSYWVSPALVGRLGPPRTRDSLLGLGYLLELSEQITADVARLAAGPPTLPAVGIAGDIRLAPEDGATFVAELQRAFGEVLARYEGGDGHPFRLTLACYPKD